MIKAMTSDETNDLGPIIVASDFSESAIEALRQGAERAKAANCELRMVHVVHMPAPIHPVFPQLSARDAMDEIPLGRQLTDRLMALAEEHTDLAPDQISVEVDFSDTPYASLAAKAEEHGARLLVVGNRGHTSLKRRLLGSVAARVVRAAHCPVLVARPHVRTRKLFAATDLSNPALLGVSYAAKEAKTLGFHLILHHNVETPTPFWSGLGPLGPVNPQPDDETLQGVLETAARLLGDQLERFGAEGETLVTAESRTDETILRLAEEREAELIVLGSRGRTGIARIALGSVAESVLQHAHCSVLTVPAAD